MSGDNDLSDDEILAANFFCLSAEQKIRHHRLRNQRQPPKGALKHLTTSQSSALAETILTNHPEIEQRMRAAELDWASTKRNKDRSQRLGAIYRDIGVLSDGLGYPTAIFTFGRVFRLLQIKVRDELKSDGVAIYPEDPTLEETYTD